MHISQPNNQKPKETSNADWQLHSQVSLLQLEQDQRKLGVKINVTYQVKHESLAPMPKCLAKPPTDLQRKISLALWILSRSNWNGICYKEPEELKPETVLHSTWITRESHLSVADRCQESCGSHGPTALTMWFASMRLSCYII